VSKFEDFSFHWSSLRNCYEKGQRSKKKDSSTGPMEGLLSPISVSNTSSTSSDVSAQEVTQSENNEENKEDVEEIDTSNSEQTPNHNNGTASLMEILGKAGFPNGIPGLPGKHFISNIKSLNNLKFQH